MSPATPSSLVMIALRSGCSVVERIAPSTARGAVAEPKSSATKFCPISPVNLIVALLSVRTSASACLTFSVTRTFSFASLMLSTRPISTPAIFTMSPFFSSCTVWKSAKIL